MEWFSRLLSFLRDVRKELTYIQWPEKKQVWLTSLAVLLFVVFTTLYLGAIDWIISFIVRKVLQ